MGSHLLQDFGWRTDAVTVECGWILPATLLKKGETCTPLDRALGSDRSGSF